MSIRLSVLTKYLQAFGPGRRFIVSDHIVRSDMSGIVERYMARTRDIRETAPMLPDLLIVADHVRQCEHGYVEDAYTQSLPDEYGSLDWYQASMLRLARLVSEGVMDRGEAFSAMLAMTLVNMNE